MLLKDREFRHFAYSYSMSLLIYMPVYTTTVRTLTTIMTMMKMTMIIYW